MSSVAKSTKVYSGFSPVSIPGCSLWLDAADRNTLTLSGTSVSQWNDKSGNARHATQATSTRRPILTSNQINGLPAIKWDGVDDNLAGTITYTLQSTVFLVYNPTVINVDGRLFDTGGNGSGNVGVHWAYGLPQTADIGLWLGGATYPTDAIYTQATASIGIKLASVIFNGTSSLIWRNGNSMPTFGSGVNVTPTGTTYTLGNVSGGGNAGMYNGYIAEIVFYSRNLTTLERQQVEGYLTHKWALVGLLPATHPYGSRLSITSPTNIPGCELWLDSADTTTLTLSGSNVTQWNDKSGLGNNASGGVSPTYSNNGVVFNGTTQYLTTAYSSSFQNETMFFVANLTAATTGGRTLIGASGNGGRQLFTFNTTFAVNKQFVQGGPAGGTVTQNAVTLFGYTSTSGASNTVNLFLNGTSAASGTLATYTTSLTSWIGRWPGSTTEGWVGPIYEIIGFSSTLTTLQRQQVESYLANKWALSPVTIQYPYKPIKPVTRAFQPVDISSCAFWLDAADSTTVTLSGTKVTQWTDKISNYAFTQSTDGNRPTYTSNALTGNNVLSFARASSQYLVGPSTLPLGTNSISMFCAFSCTDNTNGSIFNKGGAGGTGIQFWRASSLNSILLGPVSPSVDRIDFVDSTTLGTFQVTGFVNNRAASLTSAYQNGTFQKSITADITTNYTNSTLMGIGAYGNASGNFSPPYPDIYLNGNICEILIFLSALSTSERQQVEGYLANKWKTKPALISTQPFKVFSPLTVAFNPLQISTCALWLDAADRSTLTLTGTTVTAWNDKSGLGNSSTAIGGSPSYNSSTSSIALNGSSTYFAGPYINTTTTVTAFVVATVDFSAGNSAAYYRLLSVGSTAANDFDNAAYAALILHSPSSTLIGGYRNSATNFVNVTTNTRFLLANQYNATNSTLYLNGTQGAQVASTGSFNTTSYSIGRDVGNPGNQYTYWPGTISEVIIYNTSLSTSERQQVEGYLSEKWGLQTNLPTTHPYKKITP